MAGLIQLTEKNYSDLTHLSKTEYKEFLKETMKNYLQEGTYDKYKVVKDKQFFRFFLYPPTIDSVEYIENEEQREGRIELLNEFRDVFNETIVREENLADTFDENEEWITADVVEEYLSVTKRTLYNIVDDENSELVMQSHGKELKINKQSLLDYINERHIVPTNLGFEPMYKKMRTLMSKGQADKEQKKSEQIQNLVNSKAYINLWKLFENNVPPNKRVYKERQKETVEGYQIFTVSDDENLFEVYNPNVKISSEPLTVIPKMYSVNHIAALLDTTPRTVLRYCEYGYIAYFKIGGKYMFSMEDFAKGKENIASQTKQGKKNVGRKRKLEHVLGEDELFNEKFLEKYKDSSLREMKNIYKEIEELTEEENALSKSITRLKNKKESGKSLIERRDKLPAIKEELKTIKAKRNSLEKVANSLRREFFNNNLKDFEDKHKDIVEMIFERKKSIKRLRGYGENKKDKNFIKTMENTAAELEQDIFELKGKLLQELL